MTTDFQLTRRLMHDFASIDDPKGRRRTGLFVAEGTKCVLELAVAFSCEYLFASPEWLSKNGAAMNAATVAAASPRMLRDLTRLSATPPVIAFFRIPQAQEAPSPSLPGSDLVLALDRIQDPGNLGTILRTCDWMGIHTVVASPDTVDAFNPKAVQSTMGALARVNIIYTDLPRWLGSLPGTVPVYGTFLDGDNIYTSPLAKAGVIVMGTKAGEFPIR
ncbi:MAG: RNA methyltransferase [Muribaculaceae bacterium]|nr:RNA methyltransferase [Muribaculaceae bacterium]